jgi:hypothetical protein
MQHLQLWGRADCHSRGDVRDKALNALRQLIDSRARVGIECAEIAIRYAETRHGGMHQHCPTRNQLKFRVTEAPIGPVREHVGADREAVLIGDTQTIIERGRGTHRVPELLIFGQAR